MQTIGRVVESSVIRSLLGSWFLHEARWNADDDGVGRNVSRNNTTGSDDGVVSDRHALQHYRSCSDPHAIADCHRLSPQRAIRKSVLVGIHDDHISRDLAVAADDY